MSTLSTHVLDSAHGTPAADVPVFLSAGITPIAQGATDMDGRLRFDLDLRGGEYTLSFAAGDWFAAAGRPSFHPRVPVTFWIAADEHYHVALLLGPWSYTTYRGS